MDRYMTVDSVGGTKVLVILYDEDFRPLRICRVGSFRSNTTSQEMVKQNMELFQKELGLVPGTVIKRIAGTIAQELITCLEKTCTIQNIQNLNETDAGLYAAGIFGDGILALSGTGSGIKYRGGEEYFSVGGYGAAVSDAGSGYWMGREAMNAAIEDYEGRGERTLLTDLIAERFGRERAELKEAIFSLYANTEVSPAAQVASCTPLISKAAESGDAAAIKILKAAGKVLADQTLALIRMKNLADDVPLTISGSVWRSNRILFDTFISGIRSQSPDRPVHIPEFDPLMAGMIMHFYEQNREFTRKDADMLKELYPQFVMQFSF